MTSIFYFQHKQYVSADELAQFDYKRHNFSIHMLARTLPPIIHVQELYTKATACGHNLYCNNSEIMFYAILCMATPCSFTVNINLENLYFTGNNTQVLGETELSNTVTGILFPSNSEKC